MNFSYKTLAFITFNLFGQANAASLYTITDLGPLLNDSAFSRGLGINASGQVTGFFQGIDYGGTGLGNHAFVTDATHTVMTDIGSLGRGSIGNAINASGQVAGTAEVSNSILHRAFITDVTLTAMTDLGTLGGPWSWGTGINDNGQVTGYAHLPDLNLHAFVANTNHMIDLGTLGGAASAGYGINNMGQVTGSSTTLGGASHAFVTNATYTVMTDLGTLGGTSSEGLAINDNGQVAGWSFIAGSSIRHAFITTPDHSQMIDLGTLGGDSVGQGINSRGDVVGVSMTGIGNSYAHGFLYSDGTMYDLNDLIFGSSNWVIGSAFAINDAGQIIGEGGIDGATHAFVMTPISTVPIPAAFWLFCSALAGLGIVRKKRSVQTPA